MESISKQSAIDMLLIYAKAIIEIDNYLFSSSEVKLANIELNKIVILLTEVNDKVAIKTLIDSYTSLVDKLKHELLSYNNNVDRLNIVLRTLGKTKSAVENTLMSHEIPCGISVQYLITAIGYYKLETQRCLDKASGEFVTKPNMRAGNYVK